MFSSLDNALTIDVEDAINLAMRNIFGKELEPTFRVLDNTLRLLDLFDEHNVKATFFVLGEVAKTYPELVREISNRNHELGIHGYSHSSYNSLSPKEVKQEIFDSKKIVEDISGSQVFGHRAPEFSITRETIWILEILAEADIKYDSSLFPATTSRYGWSGFKKDIDWINLKNGMKIIEAPLSTVRILNSEIPVCGGGYFRIFPYFLTRAATNKVISQRPVNVYLHPYEIDPPPFQDFYMNEVKKSNIRSKLKLRTYWYNRSSVVPKLHKMLNTYKFNTLSNIISHSLHLNDLQ